jgi:hypothetical protein
LNRRLKLSQTYLQLLKRSRDGWQAIAVSGRPDPQIAALRTLDKGLTFSGLRKFDFEFPS